MTIPSNHDLLLGFLHDELDDDEMAALERRLQSEPQLADQLARLAYDEGAITEWAKSQPAAKAVELQRDRPTMRRAWRPIAVAVMSIALLLAVAAFVMFLEPAPIAVLTERAGADFAEPASPLPIGGALRSDQEYALRSGMIEIQFRCGAVVIIEGPAVFRIAGPMQLEADLGGFSVDVPQGAEGFRIHSPSAQVKDLGTRFSVHIGETGETDVQVVEGKTEVIRDGAVVSELVTGEAQRFDAASNDAVETILFDPSRYVARLPDRLIAYQAQQRDGGADELISVTVQRGGRAYTYPAHELVGIELTHFQGTANNNVLAAAGKFTRSTAKLSPQARRNLLAGDMKLNTGAINPGGSRAPLMADPIIENGDGLSASLTPGIAVRFEQAIVNGPGPDVVVFELQMSVHPPQGDAFHVSPLKFDVGLRSHTVAIYDIDRRSDEAQRAAPFHLYVIDPPPPSLAALLNRSCRGRNPSSTDFKILAVGVDLSWLGYPEGTVVEGIFIQDAADDEFQIDPTLIAGLPELK